MVDLVIRGPDGREETAQLGEGDTTIGRVDKCDIVLPHGKVSRKHAILRIDGSRILLRDAGSANGTYLNGERLTGSARLRVGDEIGIAEYRLWVEQEVHEPTRPGKRFPQRGRGGAEPSRSVALRSRERKGMEGAERSSAVAPRRIDNDIDVAEGDERKLQMLTDVRRQVHSRLLEYMNLRKMDFNKVSDQEIRNKVRSLIKDIIIEMAGSIPSWANKSMIAKEVMDEALGLGPLEDFLADSSVTEIMVNGKDQIYYEKEGKLILSQKRFTSNESLMGVIERIVAPLGRRIDESSPMVDARLKDGSRVNAIIPPLAIKGPAITIRKFAEDPFTVQDLIAFGTLTEAMAEFFRASVLGRKNIIISGGTGSGKTTLLNVFSGFIPLGERIVTIEDAAELQLPQPHVVSLESRPPNIEGKGAVAIRDLVKNSLRMRPDRIVVGECRGAEALDMLQAMNTGHDGSLTTGHANSPKDILSRLETMVLMGGVELPVQAIREQIASAIDLIVHQSRFPDGTRKVTYATEILGLDDNLRYDLRDIFRFRQEGINRDGKVYGMMDTTGEIPSYLKELRSRGIALNEKIFEASSVRL